MNLTDNFCTDLWLSLREYRAKTDIPNGPVSDQWGSIRVRSMPPHPPTPLYAKNNHNRQSK